MELVNLDQIEDFIVEKVGLCVFGNVHKQKMTSLLNTADCLINACHGSS